ncbi:multidrug MFS transporter [Rhizocola hellebori]|uniref:Multidrug MFS transporter n=1 Tax=Rhizocola hellebori TaxID=1392758 RepID=A0A8J3QK14_9ACTN|nr:epoxide hydrolase family protein [Rhizocola hellebori]GIH11150.1 multidrug MFS transporter [Rhizocola hellebori]
MLFIIMAIQRFSIDIGDEVLADLRSRILATRWPDQVPSIGWQQGTELVYLQEFLAYWADGFDWAAASESLNQHEHFMTDDGVHFVHRRGSGGLPLLLTHGWPSAFLEYLPLLPLLPDFDVVIPSLPGYGFSRRPAQTGVNYRFVASRWHNLMTELGYSRYGAGGGDFGAGVATFLAIDHPDAVTGIHLTTFELSPTDGPQSEVERAYLAVNDSWATAERGYSSIQSTKPQTVGYGLNDSPAGLAAWLLEKWNSWTDTTPSRDYLCTLLTLYWATQTITPSMRDYWDNRWKAVTPTYVSTPTAFALFPHETVLEGEPPREFAERLYNVQRWTVFDRGGHFAPIEHPNLVAADLAAFFASR